MPSLQLSQYMFNRETVPERLKKMVDSPPSSLLFEGSIQSKIEEVACAFAYSLLNTVKKMPPDLRILQVEGKGGYHSIQGIKNMIEDAHIPPYEAPYKVFLIYQAERMLLTSSNALLNIFEMPPPQVILILVTTDKASLLPTLVSRCLCVSFKEQGLLEEASLAECMFEVGLRLLKKDLPTGHDVPDIQDAEKALLYLFYFYRDLLLIQLKGPCSALFFKQKQAILNSIREKAPPLVFIQEKIQQALVATTMHIPLKHLFVLFI